MPPRSRTTRRPRVAGLRTPAAPAPEETTEVTVAPDAGDDSGSTPTRTPAPPRAAPARPGNALSVPAAAAADPTTDVPDAEPTDAKATVTEPTQAEAADTRSGATTVDTTAGTAEPTESTPGPAEDSAPATGTAPATGSAPSDTDGGAATATTAAPTPAVKPRATGGTTSRTSERPARRKSAGSLTPNPAAAGTAVKERPARSKPAPEPEREPGRFGKATRAVGGALGRFGRSRRALPITMVVVVVVCLVLAGLASWQGRKAWTDGPVANQAVIDVGGTAELVGQSREALEKIFSYDYTRLDDSVDAARTMSTGAFTDQYLSVFDQTIRTPATQQQLRQTATVVNIGVNSIRGDSAEVMALVQFNAERTSTGQSTNAPGLLSLTMKRVDGRWKLAELTPLTGAAR